MGKYKLGLVDILMGAIAVDGGAGTALTPVGDTVAGTAKMDTSEASLTDFKIEESDSPVQSIKSEADTISVSWSTYNNDAANLQRLFGGTITAGVAGALNVLGAITGGSGYANGSYSNVPLTGGTGTGATANIVVSGGVITSVIIVNSGTGYAAGTPLNASVANLGGTGTGFAVAVTSVMLSGERWNAPDAIPQIEQTLRIQMKQGGQVLIARAKISAKLTMSYSRGALSQIDITANVLQPTKVGEPRLVIINAV